MYSQLITARRIAGYEKAHQVTLRDVPLQRARDITVYLEGTLDASGKRIRPRVTPELRMFIDNERAMCKASFRYWAERYAFIEYRVGKGGIDLFVPLESQLVLLEKMARAEEENWDRKDKGDRTFLGICFMIHKARQLGFTTLCQLLLLHLTLFYGDIRTLSASVDDQKTQDMHAKWVLTYDRLPWWQQVTIVEREKDRGKKLANGGYCALQDFSQEGGLGQGMTWSATHLTELAAVDDAYCREQVQNHFLPSIADTIRVIGFMESTAQGAGNWWHQIWEQVSSGRFGRWRECFVPSYAEPLRWSRPYMKEGWEPNDETKAYADLIRRTSERWVGRKVEPHPLHLLWWEEERQMAIDTGTLNLFQANYCATPEESFQYSQGGAFNPQIIQSLQNRVDRRPVAYELVTTPSQRQAVRERMNTERDAPRILTVGPYDLVPVHTVDRDEKDPRGLVLLFELPRLDAVYSIGADPAVGIAGWDRRFRSDKSDELGKDNAVASGWYRDQGTQLVTQAFEFAGPISPRDFAVYLYVFGKLYSGANGPDRGASLIIELNNGGVEVQNVLTEKFQYWSLWQRTKSDGMKNKQLQQWGWVSGAQNVQELWIYGKDSIEQPTLPIRPRSPYLLKEMGLARWDPLRRRGEVPEGNGQHDDRISAMLFALWQLRGYIPTGDYAQSIRNAVATSKRNKIDFQEMDIASLDEYNTTVDAWYDRMLYGQ